ncbi:hypothetical protein J6590_052364 [Homalodisca vitripennis]|nr:hypothetical protein J6590_052364 [Homalodisca vitripennis]
MWPPHGTAAGHSARDLLAVNKSRSVGNRSHCHMLQDKQIGKSPSVAGRTQLWRWRVEVTLTIKLMAVSALSVTEDLWRYGRRSLSPVTTAAGGGGSAGLCQYCTLITKHWKIVTHIDVQTAHFHKYQTTRRRARQADGEKTSSIKFAPLLAPLWRSFYRALDQPPSKKVLFATSVLRITFAMLYLDHYNGVLVILSLCCVKRTDRLKIASSRPPSICGE